MADETCEGSKIKRKTEYDFKSWMGPGPNSDQIREIGPEWAPEMKQNSRNPYQMEDNKAAPSTPPKGGGASRRPLGFCCLPFGKDFVCFASFPEPILDRFSEFGPEPIQDLKSYNRVFLNTFSIPRNLVFKLSCNIDIEPWLRAKYLVVHLGVQ